MPGGNVFEADGLMMALLPALGLRAALGSRRAVLKWAGPGRLLVTGSTLDFADGAGRIVESRDGAFGLAGSVAIEPPYSRALSDDRAAPAAAVTQCWRLNGWAVAASADLPQSDWAGLLLTCLPLLVPLPIDEHFIVQLVNTGVAPLDLARGVQQAICFVDGTAWRSSAGRIWNGPYLLRPGDVAVRQFRLADFPGAPVTGTHEVVLDLLSRRSPPQLVHWHGTPSTAAG